MTTRKILGSLVVLLTVLFLFQVSPGISADHIVTNIVLTPDTPNIVAFGQEVTVAFDYSTTNEGDVAIDVTPYTSNGVPAFTSPGGVVLDPGTGSGSTRFSIPKKATITKIRIRMTQANPPNELLFKAFIPVNYQVK